MRSNNSKMKYIDKLERSIKDSLINQRSRILKSRKSVIIRMSMDKIHDSFLIRIPWAWRSRMRRSNLDKVNSIKGKS